MKNKIIVEVDDRESGMDIILEVTGLEVVKKRLKVGDYRCGDIVVERKEINDFCASIVDGRLKRQVENMKNGDKWFMIVVGHIKDRACDVHEHAILGKMVSLIVKHNMKLIFVDDDFQFAYVLKNIIEKINNIERDIKSEGGDEYER